MSISATTLRPSPLIYSAAPQPHKQPTILKCSLKPTASLSPSPTATTANISLHTTEPTSLPRKVLIPIGYGTEAMEAVIMVDVLRRAGAQVTVASVEPELQVEASGGTRLVADTSIAKCFTEIYDLIALPGGMPGSVRLRDCKMLQNITSRQAEEKRLYGAICAAPAVTLLPWGLLEGKQSTCHPAFMSKLPTFWAVKSNLQVSGELTTSRGPGTTFQFSISFVEQLFGVSAAKEIAQILLMNAAREIPRKEEINKVEWAVDHTPRVLIPIANGSEEIEVVTIVDILRRARVDVVVASVEKSLQTLGSQGMKIVADQPMKSAADSIYDCIILPGGIANVERLQRSRFLKKLLKEQESAGRTYGALCSSATILERLGLLKDKRIATDPSVLSNLDNMVEDSSRVVIDGRVITSSGLSTAIEFALAIVVKFFGHARANSVAEGLVFEYPRN